MVGGEVAVRDPEIPLQLDGFAGGEPDVGCGDFAEGAADFYRAVQDQTPSASRYTLSASGSSPAGSEVFDAEALSHVQDPDAPTLGEKCGLGLALTENRYWLFVQGNLTRSVAMQSGAPRWIWSIGISPERPGG